MTPVWGVNFEGIYNKLKMAGVQNVLHKTYNLLTINAIDAPAGGATLNSLEFP